MRLLFIGDIVGQPGRRIVARHLKELVVAQAADVVLANAENAAGGFGITPSVGHELFAMGIDLLTSGNHVWDKKEAELYLSQESRVLRPANYPEETPGTGAHVLRKGEWMVGVLNLQGRAFLPPIDCPFRAADREIEQLKRVTDTIIVDFHAEATAEKQAFGWYVDGRVSAVIGTHTHIQTADERILPGRTAYITDVGMTGPRDSVIGIAREDALHRFLTQMPKKFTMASGPAHLSAVVVDIGDDGRARSIERIQLQED
ncbi:MAG TPA: TIGR00282 family metallophosphoesterase [Candidatus Baltobacteraceae bacterium]|nr:TIGR00282 family metallophosphoesterase [Candidatus Baltobacteraceae bacterium]